MKKRAKGYSADFKHEAVSRMAQARNNVGLTLGGGQTGRLLT
jgi:hypothetical protein